MVDDLLYLAVADPLGAALLLLAIFHAVLLVVAVVTLRELLWLARLAERRRRYLTEEDQP